MLLLVSASSFLVYLLYTVSVKSFSMPSLAQSRIITKKFSKLGVSCSDDAVMKHNGNSCEDILLFRHSQIVKNSFCLLFLHLFRCNYLLFNFSQGFRLLNNNPKYFCTLTDIFKTVHHVERNKENKCHVTSFMYLYS